MEAVIRLRQSGELVQWNDERGFGFIVGPERQRVFVHVSAIQRLANRPRQGDRLSFTTRIGRDGRVEASDVRIAGANPLPDRQTLLRGTASTSQRRITWHFVAAGGLVGTLLVGMLLGALPAWLVACYLAMGGLSFALYRADKTYALAGQWRLPEMLLLGVDLCCGIIGGLVAQAIFRHKTRKISYIAQVALITLVHGLWLGALANGTIALSDIEALLRL